MRVGIVGAGIAGLAAARRLRMASIESVIFEKSPAVGGRLATRRIGEYTFDTGATSIVPRTKSLANVMTSELDTTGLVQIAKPLYLWQMGRIVRRDPMRTSPRYTYANGNNQLAKLLAANADIRRDMRVDEIQRTGERFSICGEMFDAVILTQPIPQARVLLESMGERRSLSNAFYRSCLSVLMCYEVDGSDFEFHALVEPDQRHPLTWLSLESVKVDGRAPAGCTALVAQMSPEFSTEHYDAPDQEIAAEAGVWTARLLGNRFIQPAMSQVKRWRYSQPETTATFTSANPAGTRLLVAGDGVAGARVEFAYESGLMAAERLLV